MRKVVVINFKNAMYKYGLFITFNNEVISGPPRSWTVSSPRISRSPEEPTNELCHQLQWCCLGSQSLPEAPERPHWVHCLLCALLFVKRDTWSSFPLVFDVRGSMATWQLEIWVSKHVLTSRTGLVPVFFGDVQRHENIGEPNSGVILTNEGEFCIIPPFTAVVGLEVVRLDSPPA